MRFFGSRFQGDMVMWSLGGVARVEPLVAMHMKGLQCERVPEREPATYKPGLNTLAITPQQRHSKIHCQLSIFNVQTPDAQSIPDNT